MYWSARSSKNHRRILWFFFVLGPCLVLSGGGQSFASAATLTVRDPVRLQAVSRGDLASGSGRDRMVEMDNIQATLAGPDFSFTLPTERMQQFAAVVSRQLNRVWQLDFNNNEWPGPIHVDAAYRIEDLTGRSGYISSADQPGSRAAVAVSTARIRERRRNNGSLRWIRGDLQFDIDLLDAHAAGRHSGTLFIEVNFN